MDGQWDVVIKLSHQHLRGLKKTGFLYAICKQEYLELIDRQEYQKAFTYLTTHLKPMEKIASANSSNEFHQLCYLLTCKSVNEVYPHWEGILQSRECLVNELKTRIILELTLNSNKVQMCEKRLVDLLHQAVAYQMEFSRYHPKTQPKVGTLLHDFECTIVPNTIQKSFLGHNKDVKCVSFLGKKGNVLASGGSDNAIFLWSMEEAQAVDTPIRILTGHTSRIWDLTSTGIGQHAFSASGDGTVKIWNIAAETDADVCQRSLSGHDGDVYSINMHPRETHLVTGGYDHTVKLFDIETGLLTKSLEGHSASVVDAVFNAYGNLVISGSKDGTIRFWDIMSGLCVRTLRQSRGEVSSVQLTSSGLYLLSGSKNNSNRLWDMRMSSTVTTFEEDKPVKRFKGHQNTAKNFIRARFGPRESLVLGGSEDGKVHVWDVATGNLLERLPGHTGVVYSAVWHENQALMATCSHDHTVKTWWWNETTSTET